MALPLTPEAQELCRAAIAAYLKNPKAGSDALHGNDFWDRIRTSLHRAVHSDTIERSLVKWKFA